MRHMATQKDSQPLAHRRTLTKDHNRAQKDLHSAPGCNTSLDMETNKTPANKKKSYKCDRCNKYVVRVYSWFDVDYLKERNYCRRCRAFENQSAPR